MDGEAEKMKGAYIMKCPRRHSGELVKHSCDCEECTIIAWCSMDGETFTLDQLLATMKAGYQRKLIKQLEKEEEQ